MFSKGLPFRFVLSVESQNCNDFDNKIDNFEEEPDQKHDKRKQSLTYHFADCLDFLFLHEFVEWVVEDLLDTIANPSNELNGDKHFIRSCIPVNLIPSLFLIKF